MDSAAEHESNDTEEVSEEFSEPSNSTDGEPGDLRVNRHHVRKRRLGRRLDKYLRGRYPQISRTVLQRYIKQGLVRVNGLPTKASYEPTGGDVI